MSLKIWREHFVPYLKTQIDLWGPNTAKAMLQELRYTMKEQPAFARLVKKDPKKAARRFLELLEC